VLSTGNSPSAARSHLLSTLVGVRSKSPQRREPPNKMVMSPVFAPKCLWGKDKDVIRVREARPWAVTAGVLDAISGVVIGNFSSKEVTDAKEFERVFQDYFAARKISVLMNFPVGRTADRHWSFARACLAEALSSG
jgi:hypothetical protein